MPFSSWPVQSPTPIPSSPAASASAAPHAAPATPSRKRVSDADHFENDAKRAQLVSVAPRAPSNLWDRLPTELKTAVFEQFDRGGYLGLALATPQNLALAKGVPALRWAQHRVDMRLRASQSDDAAQTTAATVQVLREERRSIQAGRRPLHLLKNCTQPVLDAAEVSLAGTARHAVVEYSDLDAVKGITRIPPAIRVTLDIAHVDEAGRPFLNTTLPAGLEDVVVDGIGLGHFLGEGHFHLFPDSVTSLSVSENDLEDAALILPPKLDSLFLADNNLTAERMALWTFPRSLTRLDCDDNDFSDGPFGLPPELSYLSLRNTQIEGEQMADWRFPSSLRLLDLRNNHIGDSPLPQLPDLQHLFLSSTGLTDERLAAWTLPSTLLQLDLSKNHFTEVPEALPPQLQYLSLAETGLSDAAILRGTYPSGLLLLDLRANPVSADAVARLRASLPPYTSIWSL